MGESSYCFEQAICSFSHNNFKKLSAIKIVKRLVDKRAKASTERNLNDACMYMVFAVLIFHLCFVHIFPLSYTKVLCYYKCLNKTFYFIVKT